MEMPVKCSRCQNENPDGALFCNGCGSAIGRLQDESPRFAVAVRCLNCGAMNSSALKTCGSCGMDLTASVKAHEAGPQPARQPARQCPGCGREIAPDAKVCTYCGLDLNASLPAKPVHDDPRPTYAAILMFGAGALGLFSVLWSLAFQELPVELEQFRDIRDCCGMLLVFLSFACILGAVFALQRKRFLLAVAGAIAGMLTVGIYVGFIMALVALILLATSQKEFEN